MNESLIPFHLGDLGFFLSLDLYSFDVATFTSILGVSILTLPFFRINKKKNL